MSVLFFRLALSDTRLDEYSIFRRVYETPILKSRVPEATTKDIEVGEARIDQVSRTHFSERFVY